MDGDDEEQTRQLKELDTKDTGVREEIMKMPANEKKENI